MNLTSSLLYLLLLYAVLDKSGKLSLTSGLIIAFLILLLNCYFNRRCCCRNNRTALNIENAETNPFVALNF